jgi:prevent-host-death family protein
MKREITQQELRNDSGEVMRALDAGGAFVVTRNGVPVADLTPLRRRSFVPKAAVLAAFSNAPAIDPTRFRADLDTIAEQNPTPRG